MPNKDISSISSTHLVQALFDYWCRSQGYEFKGIVGNVAIIDHGFGDTAWPVQDLPALITKTPVGDDQALRRMAKLTYEIRHSPNCPSRFEIRTTGNDFEIDHRRPGATRNDVGYGNTIAEAVANLEAAENGRVRGRPRAERGSYSGLPLHDGVFEGSRTGRRRPAPERLADA